MRKPLEPKIMRDIKAAVGPVLERFGGVTAYRVGSTGGDRIVVEVTLESRQRAAIWRWWQAHTKWMKGAR